jgi:hypothetical protein
MHFHLPKPLHGWREFAGEVGIIVVGVLIALGAEQVVHDIEARSNAAHAQRRIRDELGESMLLGVERVAIDRCLTRRLSLLAQGLASGRRDWTQLVLPPRPGFTPSAFREVYRMPSRNWVEDAYHEALTQGDLNSVDPDQRARLAAVYKQVDHVGQLNDTETQLSTQLATLQFNLRLSQTERSQMLATLTRLDWINSLIVLISRQEFTAFRELGYQLTPEDIAEAHKVGWWAAQLKEMHDKYGSCVDSRAVAEFDPRLAGARS